MAEQVQKEGWNPLVVLLAAIALVGALNWGLVGIFNWNLVDAVFGGGAEEVTSSASRVVYTIVGLSALGLLPFLIPRREMRPT